ncbi:PhoX family protein [Thermaurantiacus tibetensis]|uniref:PhoX family protein n=1 Tax=Thermaurantiacus tibetensis TaxID=2759035 RepID=UPI00189019E6|nr:PhoX family phosphatase [Thermaurantiacus tibetensis]
MRRHLAEIVEARLSRRGFLGGAAAAGFLATAPGVAAGSAVPPFRFDEIAHGVDATHHVAPGHVARVLLRWGDPILPGAPAFAPGAQTPEAQMGQFGMNCDFIGVLPLADRGGRERMLLCVNHEYTIPTLMFPDLFDAAGRFDPARYTARHAALEQAATGCSVVEVERGPDGWRHRVSPRNRAVRAWNSAIAISGPAAGDERLRTAADPSGTRVIGTFGNCAGGMTPWGTYLTAEENFQFYFTGTLPEGHPEAGAFRRYGLGGRGDRYPWGRFDARFDMGREPNEANRFGWVVEVDPLDPRAMPVKRTALGRFSHEGAETHVNGDGRLVIYMGDDARNEYLYRYVSKGRVSRDRRANRRLLDEGVLSVAVFDESGLDWRPLVFGEGPLTPANGFRSQADVLIEARRAADLVGATPMDRPEDVEAHPTNGRVYVMLTNNRDRTAPNPANPRLANAYGQILELVAPGGDHAADRFGWEMLVLCGPPADPAAGARWGAGTSANGWFASPDNCAFDPMGRLWVASDQGNAWPLTGTADGLWALGTEGPERGVGRMFFRVPVGAELCGPRFARGGRTLFLSVQHPGADGTKEWAPFARESTFHDPATRWPDFQPDMPPRPSVVVVERADGGVIGA